MKELIKKESLFLHYLISLPDHDKKIVMKHLTKISNQHYFWNYLKCAKKSIYHKKADLNLLKKFNKYWSVLVDKTVNLRRKKVLILRRYREISLIFRAALKLIPIKSKTIL